MSPIGGRRHLATEVIIHYPLNELFPASGYRSWDTGALNYVSSYGYSWSAVPNNATAGYILGFSSTAVNPLGNYSRGSAFSIRSVME